MLYVREFSFENYIMFALNWYLYCCPVLSTVNVPLSFISIPLYFALMYIHTRAYWSVFLKHLQDSVFVVSIYLSICFVCLFVCLGGGGSVLLLILNCNFRLTCLAYCQNFGFQRPNGTKLCGLWLKLVQPSEIRDS